MCKQCELNPVYEFTNKKKLCKTCFVKYFRKKLLYTIRKFGMIKNNDFIGYKFKGDFKDAVLEDCLKFSSEKAFIEIVKLPFKKKINKIAVSDTLDAISEKIVHELFKGNLNKIKNAISPVSKIKRKTIIRPLYLFLDKEVLLYANLRNLRFKNLKEKRRDKISIFVNEMEKKHPELKRAVVNSYLELFHNY